MAAGNTLEEAILHALLEVIERHCYTLIRLQRTPTPRIDPGTIDSPLANDILERFTALGERVWVRDFSLGLELPVIATARVAGETTPLLFTALGNNFWSHRLSEPISALPLQIFTYAISPYDDWHRQAWAGALVLMGLILTLNIMVRILSRDRTFN